MHDSKVIYYPAPETPMTRDEIAQAFAHFSPRDPVMAALRQLLVERLAAATADTMDPRLTERTAGMAAGRLEEIASLQVEIAELLKTGTDLRRTGAVEAKPSVRKAAGSK